MRSRRPARGAAFYEAVEAFGELSRSLRLTLTLDLRLAAFGRASAEPVRRRAEAAEIVALEPAEPVARPEPREREREREVEHDGYPMDPLGRVTALETLITRTPALDPDHRVSAQIIELKAFLTAPEPTPPNPPSPEPAGPLGSKPSEDPALSRSLNRAERRRLRRASG